MRRTTLTLAGLLTTMGSTGWVQAQIAKSILDGTTPPAIQASSAAGAWAISDIESINLFSGSAGLRIPLLSVGGRGGAQFRFVLPIETRWNLIVHPSPNSGGLTLLSPVQEDVANAWGVPHMERRDEHEQAYCQTPGRTAVTYSDATLTRLHWVGGDGSDVELVDSQTNGAHQLTGLNCVAGSVAGTYTRYDRGTEFVSRDGTSMTFVSDTTVVDGDFPTRQWGGTGTLYLKDGTRYKVENGKATWMSDRNGNMITFQYDSTTTTRYGGLLGVTDALGRSITIDYGTDANHPGEHWLVYPTNGVRRRVKLRFTLLENRLVSGESIQQIKELFPLTALVDNPIWNSTTHNPLVFSEVEFPDGRKFELRYNRFGELSEAVLPTGGKITYAWAGYSSSPGGQNGELSIYRRMNSRRVYAVGGDSPIEWTDYECALMGAMPTDQLVSEVHKDSNGTELRRIEHTFRGNANSIDLTTFKYAGWREGREFQTATKDGTTTLRSVVQSFGQRGAGNATVVPTLENTRINDPRVTSVNTTLGAVTSSRTFTYAADEHNNVTDECEFDFEASAATRCIHRDYVTTTAMVAVPVHLRGLVLSESIQVGGVSESTTNYEYDNYVPSLTVYAAVVQHDVDRRSTYTTRGNVTKETRVAAVATESAVTEINYDEAGNPVKLALPKVETESGATAPVVTISYVDNYEDQPGGKSTYAFPAKITNALLQEETRTYSWALARLVKSKDVNGQETSYDYTDALDRLKLVTLPIGQTEFDYNDSVRQIVTKRRVASDPLCQHD